MSYFLTFAAFGAAGRIGRGSGQQETMISLLQHIDAKI